MADSGRRAIGGHGIEARGVSKVFGHGADRVRALDDVSLTIASNEFFTLLGPSGCGKTTLLRLIAGLEQPTSGEIYLDGEEIAHLPPYRRPVNTVFQSYALFPHMTVAQNIAFGLEMQRLDGRETARRVEEMLALVKLEDLGGRRPAQLSGGQQQRVALARALANHPKVLLLDEPLSALDLKLRKAMQIELKRLQTETGITFVFVTHDQEEALTMSDRLAVMSAGRVLQVGTPTEIYEHPTRRFVADFIGETNVLEGAVDSVQGDETRVRLSEGDGTLAIRAADLAKGAAISLTVRPERADLTPLTADGDGLAGCVETIVYVGTDTTYHVRLADGRTIFTVRLQNREGAARRFAEGDAVRIAIPPGAVQVLAD